jgi:hypothetical protein
MVGLVKTREAAPMRSILKVHRLWATWYSTYQAETWVKTMETQSSMAVAIWDKATVEEEDSMALNTHSLCLEGIIDTASVRDLKRMTLSIWTIPPAIPVEIPKTGVILTIAARRMRPMKGAMFLMKHLPLHPPLLLTSLISETEPHAVPEPFGVNFNFISFLVRNTFSFIICLFFSHHLLLLHNI